MFRLGWVLGASEWQRQVLESLFSPAVAVEPDGEGGVSLSDEAARTAGDVSRDVLYGPRP
ncbi:hypothetical protein ACWCPM_23805 [Streptomyces sp. NPDC002309]